MSGGPALLIGGIGLPVVGAISEFQSSLGILRIGTFARVSDANVIHTFP